MWKQHAAALQSVANGITNSAAVAVVNSPDVPGGSATPAASPPDAAPPPPPTTTATIENTNITDSMTTTTPTTTPATLATPAATTPLLSIEEYRQNLAHARMALQKGPKPRKSKYGKTYATMAKDHVPTMESVLFKTDHEAMARQAFQKASIVDDRHEGVPITDAIREWDVLFGTGARLYRHRGNIHLRRLIEAQCQEYKDAEDDRKRALAQTIYGSVCMKNGRFLIKKDGTEVYSKAPVRISLKKIGQAFRDVLKKMRQDAAQREQAMSGNSNNNVAANGKKKRKYTKKQDNKQNRTSEGSAEEEEQQKETASSSPKISSSQINRAQARFKKSMAKSDTTSNATSDSSTGGSPKNAASPAVPAVCMTPQQQTPIKDPASGKLSPGRGALFQQMLVERNHQIMAAQQQAMALGATTTTSAMALQQQINEQQDLAQQQAMALGATSAMALQQMTEQQKLLQLRQQMRIQAANNNLMQMHQASQASKMQMAMQAQAQAAAYQMGFMTAQKQQQQQQAQQQQAQLVASPESMGRKTAMTMANLSPAMPQQQLTTAQNGTYLQQLQMQQQSISNDYVSPVTPQQHKRMRLLGGQVEEAEEELPKPPRPIWLNGDNAIITCGLVENLQALLQQGDNHHNRYLITNSTSLQHVQMMSTWDAEYRNAQMLLSALVPELHKDHPYFTHVNIEIPPKLLALPGGADAQWLPLPSLYHLQDQIECAWAEGFDVPGRDHFGGSLRMCESPIGLSEIEAMFTNWAIDTALFQIQDPDASRYIIPAFVYRYFHAVDEFLGVSAKTQVQSCLEWALAGGTPEGMDCSTWMTRRRRRRQNVALPLFLQWAGHSLVVIGIEPPPPSTTNSNAPVSICDWSRWNFLVLNPASKGEDLKKDETSPQAFRYPCSTLVREVYQLLILGLNPLTSEQQHERKLANVSTVSIGGAGKRGRHDDEDEWGEDGQHPASSTTVPPYLAEEPPSVDNYHGTAAAATAGQQGVQSKVVDLTEEQQQRHSDVGNMPSSPQEDDDNRYYREEVYPEDDEDGGEMQVQQQVAVDTEPEEEVDDSAVCRICTAKPAKMVSTPVGKFVLCRFCATPDYI